MIKKILDEYKKYRDSVDEIKYLNNKIIKLNETIKRNRLDYEQLQTNIKYLKLKQAEQNFEKLKTLEMNISINQKEKL